MGASDQSEAGIQSAQKTVVAFVIERQQPCWDWREFLSRNDTKQQQLMIDAVKEVQEFCWTIFKYGNGKTISHKERICI